MVRSLLLFAALCCAASSNAQSGAAFSDAPVFTASNGTSYAFDLRKKVAWDIAADYGIDLQATTFLGNDCISMSGIFLCQLDPRSQRGAAGEIRFVRTLKMKIADGSRLSVQEHRIIIDGRSMVQWSTLDGQIAGFCIRPEGGHADVRFLAKSKNDLLEIAKFALDP